MLKNGCVSYTYKLCNQQVSDLQFIIREFFYVYSTYNEKFSVIFDKQEKWRTNIYLLYEAKHDAEKLWSRFTRHKAAKQ